MGTSIVPGGSDGEGIQNPLTENLDADGNDIVGVDNLEAVTINGTPVGDLGGGGFEFSDMTGATLSIDTANRIVLLTRTATGDGTLTLPGSPADGQIVSLIYPSTLVSGNDITVDAGANQINGYLGTTYTFRTAALIQTYGGYAITLQFNSMSAETPSWDIVGNNSIGLSIMDSNPLSMFHTGGTAYHIVAHEAGNNSEIRLCAGPSGGAQIAFVDNSGIVDGNIPVWAAGPGIGGEFQDSGIAASSIGSSGGFTFTTTAGDYTADTANRIIEYTGAGGHTITLPASPADGQVVMIQNTSGNGVDLDPNGKNIGWNSSAVTLRGDSIYQDQPYILQYTSSASNRDCWNFIGPFTVNGYLGLPGGGIEFAYNSSNGENRYILYAGDSPSANCSIGMYDPGITDQMMVGLINLDTRPPDGNLLKFTRGPNGGYLEDTGVSATNLGATYHVRRTLSSAEILDLHNTPIEIIVAPGAGQQIFVIAQRARLNYNSIAYSSAAQIYLSYDVSGSVVPGLSDFNALTQSVSTSQYDAGTNQSNPTADVENKPVYLYASSALTNGNSTVTIDLWYVVTDA